MKKLTFRERFLLPLDLLNELSVKPQKHFTCVGTKAGMNFGSLNYSAAGSGEPAKTFGHRKLPDGTGIFASVTNPFEGRDVISQRIKIKFTTQYLNPVFIEFDGTLQEFLRATIKNHPNVEEFLPLNLRNHTNDRVFK
jgi:hypothetical protein